MARLMPIGAVNAEPAISALLRCSCTSSSTRPASGGSDETGTIGTGAEGGLAGDTGGTVGGGLTGGVAGGEGADHGSSGDGGWDGGRGGSGGDGRQWPLSRWCSCAQ